MMGRSSTSVQIRNVNSNNINQSAESKQIDDDVVTVEISG
jgi:hypothetical protein